LDLEIYDQDDPEFTRILELIKRLRDRTLRPEELSEVDAEIIAEVLTKILMNKITLVTPPDDISQDGLRILCVSLTPDQDQVVSQAITKQSDLPNTIIYVWKNGEPLEWLFDKKLKSNIIIFNGCSDSGEINGYLAAQPNSYYFGTSKKFNTGQ